jgi:hypothetical protein
LFGGVAIWERSGERMRATFGRAYADIEEGDRLTGAVAPATSVQNVPNHPPRR